MPPAKRFAIGPGENVLDVIFKFLKWSKRNRRTAWGKFGNNTTITVKPNDSASSAVHRWEKRGQNSSK